MSASHPPFYPRVKQPLFLGFMWAGLAISIFLVTFRVAVRLRSFKRLYWDDGLVIFSLALFTASSITWQTQVRGLYVQFELTRGSTKLTPKVIDEFLGSQRGQLAILFCFYTGLWSIKLSFLIFFRRLFDRVQKIRIWWWIVLILTVATWFTCIGLIQYHCLVGSLIHIFTHCATNAATHFQSTTFHYILAIDLFTDCCIISIPVLVMYNVRIPLKQKIGLIGIFSLTAFIMVIAITRVVVVSKASKTADMTWLYFWTNLETTVALIVSCLASFRQLFVKSEKPPGLQSRSLFSSMRMKLLRSVTRSSSDHSFDVPEHEKSFVEHHRAKASSTTLHSHNSREVVTSAKNIQVIREFDVRNEGRNLDPRDFGKHAPPPVPKLPVSTQLTARPFPKPDIKPGLPYHVITR